MRQFYHDIMPLIKTRWSPRSFKEEPIATKDIEAIIEAATYAPSCYNEQPFRFYVANDDTRLTLLRSLLMEGNMRWASKAPCLVALAYDKAFSHNNKDNYWGRFDLGTSFGFMILEAEKRGIASHCMGGFYRNKANEVLKVDSRFEFVAVVAFGYLGDKNLLPEEIAINESPGLRRPFKESLL